MLPALKSFDAMILKPLREKGEASTVEYEALVGAIILFVSSLPQVVHSSFASWGVFLAMSLMSLGSGGVKTIVAPFIGKSAC